MIKKPQVPAQIRPSDSSWIQTNEIPAIRPGLSTWDRMQQPKISAPVTPNWHEELPKSNHQRNLPVFREPLDYEKIAARITWLCLGIFALILMLMCMGKIIQMVSMLK